MRLGGLNSLNLSLEFLIFPELEVVSDKRGKSEMAIKIIFSTPLAVDFNHVFVVFFLLIMKPLGSIYRSKPEAFSNLFVSLTRNFIIMVKASAIKLWAILRK